MGRHVHEMTLPPQALLQRYRQRDDCFTDCYAVELPEKIDLARFVTAFYCTPLFRLERVILRFTVRRPSTDEQAATVAHGQRDKFAAWDVEDRRSDQLLMCDLAARTRSWFMVEATDQGTRLYFGSAVTPPSDANPGQGLGTIFTALLGFHKLYSRALLASARRRLA